ncbi:hypothetical protein [Bartonella sp. B1099]|uniref:hypothetical protein n=1 Tax=Bartonella sp. B1099 TaxID=2911422 RepID=UPI0020C34E95|nr:hypothetical protein [Bartonella sp. B1099]
MTNTIGFKIDKQFISMSSHPCFFASLKARAMAGWVMIGGRCAMSVPLNLGAIHPWCESRMG